MSNLNLARAKKAKNDEFYTPREAVESEVSRYHDSLIGKAIYCNCDDPIDSRFWKFFYRQFGFLKLKQLIATHYNMDGSPSYALIYKGGSDSCLDYTEGVTKVPLKGNGDFRSDECVEFLKQSDVVVTNPPFSLAREFIKQLMDYHKEFLVIGSKNWINYRITFPLIMQHKIWSGATNVKWFYQPDGSIKKFGNVGWYTNLPVRKPTDQVVVFEHFDFVPHPVYDNYPAFECSKVEDIPADLEVETDIDSDNLQGWIKQYKDDLMVLSDNGMVAHIKVKRPIYGVPITFMDKYNPSSVIEKHNLGKEFDILGLSKGATWNDINHIDTIKHYKNAKQIKGDKITNGSKINTSVAIIDNDATGTYYTADNAKGKIISKYARIFIRVKPDVTEF